jgi:hypothetical protein
VKRDSVAVGDSVFMHVSKMVKAYKMKENEGSYTDSDIFVTDVGPWGCNITLEDGTYISGSVIVAFEVKDKKRMQRCDDFSKAVSAINAYIYSHIKR